MELPTIERALAAVGALALVAVARSLHACVRDWSPEEHSTSHSRARTFPRREDGIFDRYFVSERTGMWVYHQAWRPKGTPIAAVYILHGIGEYCARYEKIARAFTDMGIIVYALDHQGHGASEGDRAYFRSMDDLVADVLQFVSRVCPTPDGLPRVLLGHSLGGLLAIHVLRACMAEGTAASGAAASASSARVRVRAHFHACVLSGPALYLDPDVATPLNIALAKVLNRVLPKMPVQGLDLYKLCTDKSVVAHYSRDPLSYLGGIRVRVGAEIMAGVRTAMDTAPSIHTPMLIVHGEDDLVCGIKGSEQFFAALASTDKTLSRYPGLKHEIFLERDERPTQDVLDWVQRHVKAQ